MVGSKMHIIYWYNTKAFLKLTKPLSGKPGFVKKLKLSLDIKNSGYFSVILQNLAFCQFFVMMWRVKIKVTPE